mgnify:CR=1 FL=1
MVADTASHLVRDNIIRTYHIVKLSYLLFLCVLTKEREREREWMRTQLKKKKIFFDGCRNACMYCSVTHRKFVGCFESVTESLRILFCFIKVKGHLSENNKKIKIKMFRSRFFFFSKKNFNFSRFC